MDQTLAGTELERSGESGTEPSYWGAELLGSRAKLGSRPPLGGRAIGELYWRAEPRPSRAIGEPNIGELSYIGEPSFNGEPSYVGQPLSRVTALYWGAGAILGSRASPARLC